DPCRLVRQVKEFHGWERSGQPRNCFTCRASRQGSKRVRGLTALADRTASPAGRAGRGRGSRRGLLPEKKSRRGWCFGAPVCALADSEHATPRRSGAMDEEILVHLALAKPSAD